LKNDWFIWSKKDSDNGSTVGSFGVDATGKLYATDADISGTITAAGGKIGNWLIEEGGSGNKILFNRAGGNKGD
jgi:hypothetical protein